MLSYAHTPCTLREREVPERGSLLRIWNAPVKQVHTRFLFPSPLPSFPPFLSKRWCIYVMSHPYCTLSLFSLSPSLDTWTKQSQLRAF